MPARPTAAPAPLAAHGHRGNGYNQGGQRGTGRGKRKQKSSLLFVTRSKKKKKKVNRVDSGLGPLANSEFEPFLAFGHNLL